MSYSYYTTAARLGFDIPNSETRNINGNAPQDYRYKKMNINTTINKNYIKNNNYINKPDTNYKNQKSSDYNNYNRYHNYNNYTTRHFTDNVAEIFYSNAYDPSKDRNAIKEIRPEKRIVFTNKFNQKNTLNNSFNDDNKENTYNNIKKNNYINDKNLVKSDTIHNNKDAVGNIASYLEPENDQYNNNGDNLSNNNKHLQNSDAYVENAKLYSNTIAKDKNNIIDDKDIYDNKFSNERLNNNYTTITNKNIDTKELFYSTENNNYDVNNYPQIENSVQYESNNEVTNNLIYNEHKNYNSIENDKLPKNSIAKKEEKINFNTDNNNSIKDKIKYLNIDDEKEKEPVKSVQDIENEKRKLYYDFANNKKNKYDVNKWSREYDKLNTLEKLNNYTNKRYNTSFDFKNEYKNLYDTSNYDNSCSNHDIKINNDINEIINKNISSSYTKNENDNNKSKIKDTSTELKSNIEKKDNNNVGPYIHSYIKNNPNPNLYDMRYYQRLNSSKRVHELLGGLSKELENEIKNNESNTNNTNNNNNINNNSISRSNVNDNITNMLKDLNKTNNENQQLKLEIQIQDRKIANLEKDLQQYKYDNQNLKKELEEKEKFFQSQMKEKKHKSENLEYLYSDCQSKLYNEKEENKNLKLYIENLEKELEISKKLLKDQYISTRKSIL